MKQRRVQEFVVPRERVTPEVARAFQSILLSLRGLDAAIDDAKDTDEVSAIQRDVRNLEQKIRRVESTPGRQEVVVRRSTEITYSTTY
ncbi:MAG: hypothetical protein OXH00_02655 [Candidatus Poribacteria bacterium]|nr:hypothetical protein [Candidatus Poribacteria bacterium]